MSTLPQNESGKRVYDVAKGFSLKQMLMPIFFAEQDAAGIAPEIPGATKDPEKEAERRRNLPPPPPSAMGGGGGVYS